jgi:hypothetical protein
MSLIKGVGVNACIAMILTIPGGSGKREAGGKIGVAARGCLLPLTIFSFSSATCLFFSHVNLGD